MDVSRKPSGTGRGISWIENFPKESQPVATKLLDSFMLVSWSDARLELMNHLKSVIETSIDQRNGPCWVLPVMGDEDTRAVAKLDRWVDPVAFDNFIPGDGILSTPGSEGAVGNMLRDIKIPGIILPKTTIGQLKKRRVRTIIIVTDLSESGSQVQDFAASLLRNRTLRSWKSGHWVQVWVVAYAMSESAYERLTKSTLVDEVSFVVSAPTIDSLPWPRSAIKEARQLCETHAIKKKDAFGYKAHGGLFAFHEGPPNTSPAIFRQQGRNWSPFFEGRRTPPELQVELRSTAALVPDFALTLTAIQQERLSRSVDRQFRPENRDLLAALALLLSNPGSKSRLAAALASTQAYADSVFEFLLKMDWIGADGAVKELGRAEMRAGKRQVRKNGTKHYPATNVPYYPSSLR